MTYYNFPNPAPISAMGLAGYAGSIVTDLQIRRKNNDSTLDDRIVEALSVISICKDQAYTWAKTTYPNGNPSGFGLETTFENLYKSAYKLKK